MSINKYTIMFQYGNYKWSESYWNTIDESVRSLEARSKGLTIAGKRANLMGTGVIIQAVRISGGVGRRNTFIVYNGDSNSPTNYWNAPAWTQIQNEETGRADNPGMAVLCRYELGQFNFATKEMSGFPDSDVTGPQTFQLGGIFSNSVNLNSAWAEWRTFITNGQWAIRTRVTGASSIINALTINNQGFISLTPATSIGVGFNSYVQVTGVQGSVPFGKINGTYRVLAPGAALTLSPKRIPPTGWEFTPSGLVRVLTYTTTVIDDVALQYVAIKKRGSKGFRATKGKAAKRA